MRNTPLLEVVLKILKKEHGPISVPRLQNCLQKQGFKPNKTSLYRLLEKLVENHQVENVLLDPKVSHFELKRHHHHHFKCEDCLEIKCVEDEALEAQIQVLQKALTAKGLKIKTHQFSFSGCCQLCQ